MVLDAVHCPVPRARWVSQGFDAKTKGANELHEQKIN